MFSLHYNVNVWIGSQVGIALGFLIPPIAVSNHDQIQDIGHDLFTLYYGMAISASTMLTFIVLCRSYCTIY